MDYSQKIDLILEQIGIRINKVENENKDENEVPKEAQQVTDDVENDDDEENILEIDENTGLVQS